MNCINLPKNSLVFAISISLTLTATYKDELRDFERSSPEMNFPEDMDFGIKSFRRDLKSFPKLGYIERMAFSALKLNIVPVNIVRTF